MPDGGIQNLHHLVRMAMHTAGASLMAHAPGAELAPLETDYWMVDVLTKKFGQATVDGYRKSLQSRGLLPQTVLRTIDSVAFPAAVLAALAFGAASVRRGRQQEIALVARGVGLRHQCSALRVRWGVHDRLQARVTWLFPLAALLILVRLVRSEKSENVPLSTAT
jgi:hypothetical protein